MNNKKIFSIVAIIVLVAVLGVCLAACNADSYEKKLKKAGYEVAVFEGKEAQDEAEVGDYEVKWTVVATKGLTEIVTVAKFAKSADAKKVADEIKEGKKGAGSLGNIVEVYRIGSIVIFGTADAVKDAK